MDTIANDQIPFVTSSEANLTAPEGVREPSCPLHQPVSPVGKRSTNGLERCYSTLTTTSNAQDLRELLSEHARERELSEFFPHLNVRASVSCLARHSLAPQWMLGCPCRRYIQVSCKMYGVPDFTKQSSNSTASPPGREGSRERCPG